MPTCCDCGKNGAKREFSKAQLKKAPDKRRCLDCAFNIETVAGGDVERPSCWICLCDDQTRANPIVRDCGCRGTAGNVHIECLVGMAKSKSSQLGLEMKTNKDLFIGTSAGAGGVPNPWEECTTCKQPFLKNSRSCIALAKAALATFPCAESNFEFHLIALQANAAVKEEEGDLIGARKFMDDQINVLRGPLVELTGPNPYMLCNTICNKAVTYMTEEECDGMLPLLDEASEYARMLGGIGGANHGEKLMNARISILRGHYASLKRDASAAIEYIGEAIDIYRSELPGSAELSHQLWKSGHLKYGNGDTKEGLREQTESLIILERLRGGEDSAVISRKAELEDNRRHLVPLATGHLLVGVGGYISPETAKLGDKIDVIKFFPSLEGQMAYAVKKANGQVSMVPVHEVRLDSGSHVDLTRGIPSRYGIKCGKIIRYDRQLRAYFVDAGQFELQCGSAQCVAAKPSNRCCLR